MLTLTANGHKQEFSVGISLSKSSHDGDITVATELPIPLSSEMRTIVFQTELAALKCKTHYLIQNKSDNIHTTLFQCPARATKLYINKTRTYLSGLLGSLQVRLGGTEIIGSLELQLVEKTFQDFMTEMKWLNENLVIGSKVSFLLAQREREFELYLTDVIVSKMSYTKGKIEIRFARNNKVDYVKTGF